MTESPSGEAAPRGGTEGQGCRAAPDAGSAAGDGRPDLPAAGGNKTEHGRIMGPGTNGFVPGL